MAHAWRKLTVAVYGSQHYQQFYPSDKSQEACPAYPLLRHTRGSERGYEILPKVTHWVCMPTHKPKESDPSIGSLNNYREMVGH